MVSESFWKRFDDAIEHKGLSVKFVAESCGIKYQTFKNQRSSKTVPRVDDILVIAPLIGLSLDYLLTGKEAEPFSYEAIEVEKDDRLKALVRAVRRNERLLSAISVIIESYEEESSKEII